MLADVMVRVDQWKRYDFEGEYEFEVLPRVGERLITEKSALTVVEVIHTVPNHGVDIITERDDQ